MTFLFAGNISLLEVVIFFSAVKVYLIQVEIFLFAVYIFLSEDIIFLSVVDVFSFEALIFLLGVCKFLLTAGSIFYCFELYSFYLRKFGTACPEDGLYVFLYLAGGFHKGAVLVYSVLFLAILELLTFVYAVATAVFFAVRSAILSVMVAIFKSSSLGL